MALVPYTLVSWAESDATGTNGKNIIENAVVSLFLPGTSTAITLYDNASSGNPSTTKTTGTDGQVTFWCETGNYDLEVNGQARGTISVAISLEPTDSPTDTAGVLRAEDAYDTNSINYHTGNLNVNEFGGQFANDVIAKGFVRNPNQAYFYLRTNSFSGPTSISVDSTFSIANAGTGVSIVTGIPDTSVLLDNSGPVEQRIVVNTSGLPVTAPPTPLILISETASSKITVNF